MKKAIAGLALILFLSPFSIAHAALFGSQTLGSFDVASSTTSDNVLFWLGTGDGVTTIDTATMLLYNTTEMSATLRYTCFSTMATSSSPAPAQTGCVDTSPINSDTITISPSGSSPSLATFNFPTRVPLQNGKWFVAELLLTSTGDQTVFGSNVYQEPFQCTYGGNPSACIAAPYILFNVSFGPPNPQTFATSTASLFGNGATTTLAELAGTCSQSGNLFADGMCSAFAFLFVPSTETASQFASIPSAFQNKVPFSYVSAVYDTYQVLSTSTPPAMPIISIPLSSVASSTVTGVIPDIELSTTTISTYLSPSIHNILKLLLSAALWLAGGWYVFGKAMNILAKHT